MVMFIGLVEWYKCCCCNSGSGMIVSGQDEDTEAVKQDPLRVNTTDQSTTAAAECPNTLEEFGYAWDEKGQLRCKKSGEPFKFDVYDGDRSKNQKRYEAIGDVITESIYEKLVEAGCKKIFVPIDASEEDARSFFFATDDAWDNKVGLAVLIHGSGAVRAGQWARRLIINESLDAGTQLPYIREFKSRGFGVVVLNTNLNRAPDGQGKMQYVEENGSPDAHGTYVWRHFIEKAKVPHIVIVAHSYGGCVTQTIARTFEDHFVKRVVAVCFTDSVHSSPLDERAQSAWWKHMLDVAQNWVTSKRPVGAREKRRFGGVLCASAGTPVHEETSWKAIESVFEFVDERMSKDARGVNEKDHSSSKKARMESSMNESLNGHINDDGFEELEATIADD